MTIEVTIDGRRFTSDAHGVVVKHFPFNQKESYRRADNERDYEFYCPDTRTWKPGLSMGVARDQILKALDRLWPASGPSPKDSASFRQLGWIPAGEGCVRATAAKTHYARFRRAGDRVEGQSRMPDRQWHLCSHDPITKEALDALDHFWPLQKDTIAKTFEDRTGEIWRREGDELRSNRQGRIWRNASEKIRVSWTADDIGVNPGSKWAHPVIEALAPDWLDSFTGGATRAAAAPVKNSPVFELGATVEHVSQSTDLGLVCKIVSVKDSQGRYWIEYLGYEGRQISVNAKDLRPYQPAGQVSDEIGWTFVAVPEKVDIARCLCEAFESGAREVTLTVTGEYAFVGTYVHQSVNDLVRRHNESQEKKIVGLGTLETKSGTWYRYAKSYLADARAWEAEERAKAEKARRVRVTVKGIR